MKRDNQLKQQNENLSGIFSKALLTGFIGGVLWSLFGVLMYYFKFAEVGPKTFLVRSWLTTGWTNGWLGEVLAVLLAGIISLLPAAIYYVLLKKINSMLVGVFYGVILWGLIFFVLHPIFSNVPELTDLQFKSVVSSVCLFILYGVFIGYSISFDYHNMKVREKHQKQVRS